MTPDVETPPPAMIPTTPLRILVADDQDTVRITVRMILEGQLAGSIISEAATGREAVERAVTQNPDVILMDLMMPGVSGIDATRQIMAAQPKAKIIMFSGYRSRDLINQAREAGSVGYLFKPFAPGILMHAIREVINGQLVFPTEELA
jgi:DNA-binding NarL/FixJ family response regulator